MWDGQSKQRLALEGCLVQRPQQEPPQLLRGLQLLATLPHTAQTALQLVLAHAGEQLLGPPSRSPVAAAASPHPVDVLTMLTDQNCWTCRSHPDEC